MDILTLLAGAFVKDLYKWFKEAVGGLFLNPKAEEQAKERLEDLVARLNSRLRELDEEQKIDRAILSVIVADPSFHLFFRAATMRAVDSPSEEQREMLARLIAARLFTDATTFSASVLSLAAEIIPRLHTPHFALLAYHAAIRFGAPVFSAEARNSEATFASECNARLVELLAPFREVQISAHDLDHVETLGCGSIPTMSMGAGEGIGLWEAGGLKLGPIYKQLAFFQAVGPHWHALTPRFRTLPLGDFIGLAAIEAAGCKNLGVRSWTSWKSSMTMTRA